MQPHAKAGARPRAKAQLDGADVAGEGRTCLMSEAVKREERSGHEQGGKHADVQGGEESAGGDATDAAHKRLQGGGDTE